VPCRWRRRDPVRSLFACCFTARIPIMEIRQLQDFLKFLRFASISTDFNYKVHVRACAEWLAEKLAAIGLQTAIHPTPGHPIITAQNAHRSGRRTVMIYGHYDVQPVDPVELWTSPPFEPRIENDVGLARGAAGHNSQAFS